MSNILQRLQQVFRPSNYSMSVHKQSSLPIMSLARQFRANGVSEQVLVDPIFRPISSFSQFVAPNPPNAFVLMKDAYENDPEVSFGIDFITAVSVGVGFHFSAAKDKLVDHVNQFAQDSNLDDIVQTSGRETLAYGNSIWQYKDITTRNKGYDVLEQIPLTALKRIWWTGMADNATVGSYEFRGWKTQKLMPSEVIHFRWRISNASPIALGLLYPLVTRVSYRLNQNGIDSTRERMSIIEIKRSMQDMTHKFMRRYQPRNVYNLKNASPQQVTDAQSSLNILEDEQDFVMPGDAEIFELGSAAKAFNLDHFHALYANEIIKAIGTPTSRLYEKGALTEASADSAKDVALMNLVGFQRNHKRMIERMLIQPWYKANPLTDANGVFIPWEETKIELNWGIPEKPKMDAPAFTALLMAKPTAFSDEEVRKFASQAGIELDESTWKAAREERQQMEQQQMKMKQDLNRQKLQGLRELIE